MSVHQWFFPRSESLTFSGIESTRFDSTNSGIKTLVREACQNSCDAMSENQDRVTIEFERFTIRPEDFPDSDGFRQTLERCMDTADRLLHNDKNASRIFNEMSDALDEPIDVLRISDFGTTGATGSSQGNQSAVMTPWRSLVFGKGVSNKSAKAGGSFGRGKETFFAASQFRTVFYSTVDEEGDIASIGCSEMMDHYDADNNHYDYFGICGDKNRLSNGVSKIFSLGDFRRGFNQYGTDVYIVGFNNQDSDWKDQILSAVIEEFFVKIIDGELVVRIGNDVIDCDSIEYYISKLSQNPEDEGLMKTVQEQMLMYRDEDPYYIDDCFRLYIKKSEISSQVASARSGMVICHALRVYSGIVGLLVVDDPQSCRLLSRCETSAHDSWNTRNMPSSLKEDKKEVRRLLSKFTETIDDAVKELKGFGSDDYLDAEGLDKYLALDPEDTERYTVTVKERAWNPITTVKHHKKKRKVINNTPSESISENEETSKASNAEPNSDFTDTGALNQKDKERGEDLCNFQKDPNGNVDRIFKVSSEIKMTNVTPVSSRTPEGFVCNLVFDITKEEPYFLRVYSVMFNDGLADAIPFMKVTDSEGNDIPIVNKFCAGPITSKKGSRNRLQIVLDYPIACKVAPEVLEIAN